MKYIFFNRTTFEVYRSRVAVVTGEWGCTVRWAGWNDTADSIASKAKDDQGGFCRTEHGKQYATKW